MSAKESFDNIQHQYTSLVNAADDLIANLKEAEANDRYCSISADGIVTSLSHKFFERTGFF